jgi:hypothetical protein
LEKLYFWEIHGIQITLLRTIFVNRFLISFPVKLLRIVFLISSSSVSATTATCLLFCCVFVFLLFFVLSYCLPVISWLDPDVEAFVTDFVLVPFSFLVIASDFDSACSAPTSFQWLILFLSGSSDRFALICAYFASITALCSLLRGPSHLFDPFPMLCNYFCTVLVYFGFVVGEPTRLLILGLLILFSFWIRNEKNLLM